MFMSFHVRDHIFCPHWFAMFFCQPLTTSNFCGQWPNDHGRVKVLGTWNEGNFPGLLATLIRVMTQLREWLEKSSLHSTQLNMTVFGVSNLSWRDDPVSDRFLFKESQVEMIIVFQDQHVCLYISLYFNNAVVGWYQVVSCSKCLCSVGSFVSSWNHLFG